MMAPWVVDEMKAADLKDKRLDNRLREVLSQLGAHPTASIPAACGGYAEMAAAYRLFDNEKATFASILRSHSEVTRERMAQQSVAVLAQDTTEVDVTRPGQGVAGAGPLDGGARRGGAVAPVARLYAERHAAGDARRSELGARRGGGQMCVLDAC